MSDKKPTYSSLKKEISAFLIIFGLFLGYVSRGELNESVPLNSVIFILAVMHMLAGVWLAATSNKLFAVLGAIAGTLHGVLLLVFGFFVSRYLLANMVNLLTCVIPVVLWIRVSIFLRLEPEREEHLQDVGGIQQGV